jgi:hypothetical protein
MKVVAETAAIASATEALRRSPIMSHVMNEMARRSAKALVNMVRPALLPAERHEFYLAAYRLLRSLLAACQWSAGQQWRRFTPSMN